jgi:uncharacterized protein YjbI with pentapeptide repeats
VTDRYIRAIEQLGSDKLDVRIGGIYALERIAGDSPRDHQTVIEVLAAFAREHGREQVVDPDHEGDTMTRADVIAALQVVGRRDASRDIRNLNLAGVVLHRADLKDANLARANLVSAKLTRCFLNGADLSEARLFGANLSGATLDHTNLADAGLAEADLSEVNFWHTDLSRAHLEDTSLAGAIVIDAKFVGARFYVPWPPGLGPPSQLSWISAQQVRPPATSLMPSGRPRSRHQTDGNDTQKVGVSVSCLDPTQTNQMVSCTSTKRVC